MAPIITVSAANEKQIATYPREYALFRQLDHTHKGKIPLQVRYKYPCFRCKELLMQLKAARAVFMNGARLFDCDSSAFSCRRQQNTSRNMDLHLQS